MHNRIRLQALAVIAFGFITSMLAPAESAHAHHYDDYCGEMVGFNTVYPADCEVFHEEIKTFCKDHICTFAYYWHDCWETSGTSVNVICYGK